MDHLFFNGWQPLLRIIIVGICSYVVLVLLLRIVGKRTLSRMNAYDMVITMALGSILGKVLLSPEISIAESVTATLLLVALQYGVSVAMYHFRWVRHIISSKPAILFYEGHYIESTMQKERVDKDEIEAAMHEKGIGTIASVKAVILGTNGDLSVVLKASSTHPATVIHASKHTGEI